MQTTTIEGVSNVGVEPLTVDWAALSTLTVSRRNVRADGLDQRTVEEYAAVVADREAAAGPSVWPFPEIVLDAGGRVVCGRHRVAAAVKAGFTGDIPAYMVSDADAIRIGLAANTTHGVRRSRGDVAAAIAAYHEWVDGSADHSLRDVAEMVKCSPQTVADWRARVQTDADKAAKDAKDAADKAAKDAADSGKPQSRGAAAVAVCEALLDERKANLRIPAPIREMLAAYAAIAHPAGKGE